MKITYFYPTEKYFIGGSGEYEKVLNTIFKDSRTSLTIWHFSGSNKIQIVFANIFSVLVGLHALINRYQIGIIANSKFLFLICILNALKVPYVIDFRSNSLFSRNIKFHKRVKIILCAQHQLSYLDENYIDQVTVIPTPFYEFPSEENVPKKHKSVTVYIASDHAFKFQMLNTLLRSETLRNFNITVFVDDTKIAEKCLVRRQSMKISSLKGKNDFYSHLSKTETLLILSRSEGIPRIAIEAVWLGCSLYVPSFLKELTHLKNVHTYENVENIGQKMQQDALDAYSNLKTVREKIKNIYGYRHVIKTYQDIFCF